MGGMVVDNFAGGGGATSGIEEAIGRPVDLAVNHSRAAVAMHRANHPATHHACQDIWTVDPKTACGGRRVRLAWFSPDCTHFSRAKGAAPKSREVRDLAHVVVKWARDVRPELIFVENVEEFQTWGPLDESGHPDKARAGETFRAWVAALRDLGYSVEWRCLVAADYGTPTTRKRIVVVARADGRRIVWPEPTHGKGRPRPWRAAAEVIDWALPCPSIFDRKRPLADATLKRIAAGLRRYVIESGRPFIVPVTHHKSPGRVHGIDEPFRTITAANRGELALVTPFVSTQFGQSVGRNVDAPLPTVTGGGMGHQAIVAPTLVQTGYGERAGQRPRAMDINRPLGTVVSGGKHALVAAFLAKHYGGVVGHGVERPLGTVTTQDHHSLVTAQLDLPGTQAAAFVTKFYGTSTGADARGPLPTVTTGGGRGGGHLAEVRAFLVKYYGSDGSPTSQQQSLFDPMHTVTTKARFGLVTIEGQDYQITDIGMRMLSPRELFSAQGFAADYIIDPDPDGHYLAKRLTKTEQIELAGNSVCKHKAAAVVAANLYERPEALTGAA